MKECDIYKKIRMSWDEMTTCKQAAKIRLSMSAQKTLSLDGKFLKQEILLN